MHSKALFCFLWISVFSPSWGEILFYHTDHLGSTGMVSGSHGVVSGVLRYAPFGERIRGSGDRVNPYSFIGGELDSEEGLYNFTHRYYDPTLSYFVLPDPYLGVYRAGFKSNRPESLNPYSYVQNSPINWVDPQGLSSNSISWMNFEVTPHLNYRIIQEQRGIAVRIRSGEGFTSEGENEVLETLAELAGVFPHEMEAILQSDIKIVVSLTDLGAVRKSMGYSERIVAAGLTACVSPYCIISLGDQFFGKNLNTPKEKVLLRGIIAHEIFGHVMDEVQEPVMSRSEEVEEEQAMENERRAITNLRETLPLLAEDSREEDRFNQALEAYEYHLRTGDVGSMRLFLKEDVP